MTTFRVWAPIPSSVELELGGQRRLPMRRADRGWWSLDVPDAGPGTDYAFVLDGDGPFPDPRSPFQPTGVHGPSRTVDHSAFDWTDDAWLPPALADSVLYELHVGTFSGRGTFEGAIEHLDALVELGVTHVELMPVVEFPGDRGWGYDGVDLYAPHHAYGGPEGLKRLVSACHERGIGVIVDVVYNHLGPDGNYLARFGPYFSPRYRTPWGDAMNFDGPGSDEVRRFVIDNARLWQRDYHVDGIRLDAVHEIFDQSAIHILEELATEVHGAAVELGRTFAVISESDLNAPRIVEPLDHGGFGHDAQWNDDFRHSLHVALTGETDAYHGQYLGIHDLASALKKVFVFDGRYSAFRERRHGRPVRGLPATRFIGFLQNHDQTGNRMLGERSAALMPPGALKIGAAIVILGPFVPLLFMGEEWAASTPFLYFTDHRDDTLAEAVRRGRREEFAQFLVEGEAVPDPQAVSTFEASRLDWPERGTGVHAELLDWHRRLVAYRRDRASLRDGSLAKVRFDEQRCWLSIERGGIVVAANASADAAGVPLEHWDGLRLVLASDPVIRLESSVVALPPWSVAVVELEG